MTQLGRVAQKVPVGSAAARLIVIVIVVIGDDGDGEDDDKMVMVLSDLRQEPSDGNQTPNLGSPTN